MGSRPRDVTGAELSILKVLWSEGAQTIRQLVVSLYPTASASHYATVKKLLSRLELKGVVRRDRRALAHVFEPAISRDDLIGRRLRVLAENLCDGSHAPLLLHLLRAEDLDVDERRDLHAWLDRLLLERRLAGGAGAAGGDQGEEP
jgi:predicted transcriptional regulator